MLHSLGPRLSMKWASLSSPSQSLHSKRRGGIRSLKYKKCIDGKPEVVVIQVGENNIIACKVIVCSLLHQESIPSSASPAAQAQGCGTEVQSRGAIQGCCTGWYTMYMQTFIERYNAGVTEVMQN